MKIIKNRNFLIILFLIICISIFGINEYFSKKGYDGSSWNVYENLPENSIDLLFLGNSHSYTSFDPEIISEATGLKSFALGSPNSTLPLVYFELSKALKTQSPKYVVLETYVFDAIENDTFHINYLHRSSFDWEDLKLMKALFKPNEYFQLFITSTHHETYWKEPNSFILDQYFNRPQVGTGFLGYHSTQEFINKEEFLALRELKGSVPKIDIAERDDYQYYLEKIMDLCKANDVELILTSIPVVTDYRNKEALVLVDYSSFVKRYQIPYINLDDGNMNLSWMNFYNNGHLSMMGSINSSVEFVKRFSLISGETIDEDYLSNFSDYHFIDFDVEIKDGFLTISLIPKNNFSENHLQYEWTINYVTDTFHILTDIPEATIDLNDKLLNDLVRVHVKISNETIDYPLSLSFKPVLYFKDIVK